MQASITPGRGHHPYRNGLWRSRFARAAGTEDTTASEAKAVIAKATVRRAIAEKAPLK